MAILEGAEMDAILAKVTKHYVPVLLANWQVWPLLQMLSECIFSSVGVFSCEASHCVL